MTVYQWPKMRRMMNIEKECRVCCFHPQIAHLLAVIEVDLPHKVDIYDVRSGHHICAFQLKTDDSIIDFCFTPDGQRIIACIKAGNIQIWDCSHLL